MVKNYDLKTYSGRVTAARADLGLGAVPANMKRYITYLKFNNILAAATVELDESDVLDGATGTNTRKDLQRLTAGDTLMYPDTPNVEHPIMSFDEGKFITLFDGSGADTELTFQYYDE